MHNNEIKTDTAQQQNGTIANRPPKLRRGVALAKRKNGRMPTKSIRGDKHRKKKNMLRNTNRAASRDMREMAKARAWALELKARMYAEGIWPAIPPPFIIAKLPP